ncbi:putative HNHc nuclease, partial [Enterococcus gallinarum]
ETFTFYAGCRQHHQEEHQIGTKNFLNKYQIKPVKLNIEERKKLNIGG